MKHFTSFTSLLFILMASLALAQNDAIRVGGNAQSWNIFTRTSVYQVEVSPNGDLNAAYYGNQLLAEQTRRMAGAELPIRGGGQATTTPALEVIFSDGVRDLELVYVDAQLTTVDGYPSLKIRQKDKYYPLEVYSYFRVLPEYDLIEKWIEVVNTGKKGSIKVENLQSASFYLPKDSYALTHFSGIWAHEFRPQTTLLTQGTKTIEVKDFKSYSSSTFIIRPEGDKDEYAGKAWFGTLAYSGNWRVDFQKSFDGSVQVTGGINFWDQDINLKPTQSFTTPRMTIGYTEQGPNGATQCLTSYIREKLLPASHREKLRPVLYNSWYATDFRVNEAQQLALAKTAKELGVEMFVIDDGWFKGRVNDHAGLGDWTVDKEKFPNGLKNMIDQINAMGLEFGIWIEPEMVNPNSDLYRAHPDWVFHFPNRQRHEGRNQLILNLAREDVYQYLYKCFSDLLRSNNIKFIKWDMNRLLTDPGFPSASAEEQRGVRIKYVENLYRLVETLRKEFPDVWFENCSGGGGRIDLGMAARFDFNWVSDNTDPIERIFIQDAYLRIFPANTMISWVTHQDWHQQSPTLEYKFDVSMAGVLGVGYDITKWSPQQMEVAQNKIALYKRIRETVQQGKVYRLLSPYTGNRSVLQYVSKDKRKAVIFVYNLAEYPSNTIEETQRSQLVRMQGLLPEKQYSMDGVKETYSGKYLMEVGIQYPLKGAYKSKIILMEAVQ